MRKILHTLILSLMVLPCMAQEESTTYPDIYLDTVQVRKQFFLNDYMLFGVHYGVTLCNTLFNPVRDTEFFLQPNTFGASWSLYGKMFGYMPYFGVRLGAFYTHGGYKFKEDKETHITPTMEGATQVWFDLVEVPFQALLHYDFEYVKVLGSIGPYGGWRKAIRREGPRVTEGLENAFKDTDIRLDYGLKGGLGFGLVFDPFEIHFEAQVKWAWSSLYQPDWYSQYYYRFAYPFDIAITVGLQYQLTRRTGRTRKSLRKEAYDTVYGIPDSESR